MNLVKVCWVPLALVMCLSGAVQSRGQTTEQRMTINGFEPVVNCDRRTNSTARVQYLWTDTSYVYWTISTDQGATWSAPTSFGSPNTLDPFAACDLWSTNNSVPRIMYFGYFAQGSFTSDYFVRSSSGTNVDNPPVMAQTSPFDRPWLAADSLNLYFSVGDGSNAPNSGRVKVAAIPGPTCTPSPCPVTWPSDDHATVVFTSGSGTAFLSNYPVAAHIDSGNTERAFMMALDHEATSCCTPNNCNAFIHIKRSVSQNAWGNEQLINITGFDGFVYPRDYPMLNYHITRDPNPSRPYVYAFYVLNEASGYSQVGHPPDRNVLHCYVSLKGGDSWADRMVFTLDESSLPPNGFAYVPNCANQQNSPGFYRIGRVWSSVDDNGYVYVAWMDNRHGVYGSDTTKDYWYVYCSRSITKGDSWSPPIQVSGTSDLSTASIGGFNVGGQPPPQPHVPPGDFLTCDADNNRLYVAWPDNRQNQDFPSNPIQAYFRRVDF